MAKTNRIVKDLDHAIKIYGGPRKFAQSFEYTSTEFIVRWHQFGVPAGARLGLFMGLMERGYIPHPRLLYGVTSWRTVLGVGWVLKRRAK
jgi:hypothetical protein